MKKLLTLLGSVSIVAAASATVVACKNETPKPPPTTPDGKDEIKDLINNLKKDVLTNWNEMIVKPMAPKANFLQNDIQNDNYNFFKKDNLEKVYNISALKTKINEANELLTSSDKKPDDAKTALQDAINEVKGIQTSEPAVKGLKKLEEAIEAFKAIPDATSDLEALAKSIAAAKQFLQDGDKKPTEAKTTLKNAIAAAEAVKEEAAAAEAKITLEKAVDVFNTTPIATPHLEALAQSIKNAKEVLAKGMKKPEDAKTTLKDAITKAIAVNDENEAEVAKTKLEAAIETFHNTKDQENFLFYGPLTESPRKEFRTNINTLLKPSEAMGNLKKAISLSKYSVLLGTLGEKWIDDIKFDWNNAKIEYIKAPFTPNPTPEQEEKEFLANITLGYSTEYKYNDAEEATQTNKIDGTITVAISDNKIWIDTISNVYSTLAANLLTTGDDLVWIDKQDLEKTDQNNLKIDATDIIGNSNKYNATLEAYYKKKIIDDLPQKIVDDYFANSASEVLKNVKPTPNSIINIQKESMNRKNELGAMNLQNVRLTQFFNQGSSDGEIRDVDLEKQKLYLGEINDSEEVPGDWDHKTLADGTMAKNKYLYKDLKEAFDKQKAEHEKIFEESYNEILKPKTSEGEKPNLPKPEHADIAKMKKRVVKHEQITIEGISLKTANGYSQKLNPLPIDLAVAVNKTSDKESSSDGYAFAAYYNGVKHNLDVFHRFYGMRPTDISEQTPWDPKSKNIPRALVFYMTGKPIGEDGKEVGFNIWDYWAKIPADQSFLNKKRTHSDKFTEALNLKTNSDNQSGQNPRQIWTEHLLSKLYGSSSFEFNFKQSTMYTGTYEALNEYKIEDNPKELKPGLVLHGTPSGAFSRQAISFTIKNDLFKIQIGKNWDKNHGNAHNSGDKIYTLIGKWNK
ncbi:lipoprotein [Williamsoniiplasma luminosum]|uniref:Lipoprotein n=1 Tax=Williamsoniiplasma luminosum TaxID=214888 RepID=A0A2S0NJL4_9MOLU|nr:lipoprotein [Williamsoniiplasma luminosum]AVP49199.1 MAG: hypothetical protein C5T88_01195 [Williamsoniiplasma luminosum]